MIKYNSKEIRSKLFSAGESEYEPNDLYETLDDEEIADLVSRGVIKVTNKKFDLVARGESEDDCDFEDDCDTQIDKFVSMMVRSEKSDNGGDMSVNLRLSLDGDELAKTMKEFWTAKQNKIVNNNG